MRKVQGRIDGMELCRPLTVSFLLLMSSGAHATTINFFQDGYENGGSLSGSFTGDEDESGSIFTPDLTDLSITWSGNSEVSGFSVGLSDFLLAEGSLSYRPDVGGFSLSYFLQPSGDVATIAETCRPEPFFCGNVSNNGATDIGVKTNRPVQVSLDPISPPPPGEIGSSFGRPVLPDEDGLIVFDIPSPDDFIFIDPEIAIGYDYLLESGPSITSVLLSPEFGDGLYDLWSFDENLNDYFDSGIELIGGEEFMFSESVDKFRILGIEESEMLDPLDPEAFVTGLKFEDIGKVVMRQIPVTKTVPEPSSLALLSFGVVVLGFFRKRKNEYWLNK